jgi:hypothetical protein
MHARMAEQGLMKRDPVNEAIGLQLDMINILCVSLSLSLYLAANSPHSIRLVQILSMNNRKKWGGRKPGNTETGTSLTGLLYFI